MPALKKGSKNHIEIHSPVSVLSILSKIFEKILSTIKHKTIYLLKNHIYSKNEAFCE